MHVGILEDLAGVGPVRGDSEAAYDGVGDAFAGHGGAGEA